MTKAAATNVNWCISHMPYLVMMKAVAAVAIFAHVQG
jgi:hypothetical protein